LVPSRPCHCPWSSINSPFVLCPLHWLLLCVDMFYLPARRQGLWLSKPHIPSAWHLLGGMSRASLYRCSVCPHLVITNSQAGYGPYLWADLSILCLTLSYFLSEEPPTVKGLRREKRQSRTASSLFIEVFCGRGDI
jgi:hypothetical protein